MEPFSYDTTKQILFLDQWMKNHQIVAGFTTKFDGDSKGDYDSNNLGLHVGDNASDVIQNRERLANKIDFPLKNWVFAEQTHGPNIKHVSMRDSGKGSRSLSDSISDTDGLWTKDKGIMLALLFADCVPLYFLSDSGSVAISHAGWRGTVHNIAGKTVNHFIQSGIAAEQLEVAIGPSICPGCYQVSKEVIEQIPQRYNQVYRREQAHYYLDLKQLNYLQLVDAGITPANIYLTNYCTFHDELFFSHRRDQQKTGRMLGFIGSV
ncbi:peptidoglycan editing factor PgeF [Gracilibacillus oryzae]|uniref:Purine nucleoside phosphorylase n=1 Tax=Gracilibacillus oryzae TaxID=1672701 RepID=A0A7C8GVA6_9BACI|nr:peptidoglycan editing factor PgeF [Gracilibacillus oryzae]KAB8138664.1 peptidoglycan editing factor PgeF [Gracilibacillus oryzae]